VEDLPVEVKLVAMDERSYTFKLSLGKGSALFHATRRSDSPVADAHFSAESPRAGALFWREVARWLQLAPPAASRAEAPRLLRAALGDVAGRTPASSTRKAGSTRKSSSTRKTRPRRSK
jgi:hypothetical protein